MENINELTDYLDPGRHQREEWKGEHLFLINGALNTEAMTVKKVSNADFRSGYVFKKIPDYKGDGTVFYIDETNPESLVYFYERISLNDEGEEVFDYQRIRANATYDWVTFTTEELEAMTKVVITEYAQFFFSQHEEKMYLRTLNVVAVSFTFNYSPEDLNGLENGEKHWLNYVDHEGYGSGGWDTAGKLLLDGVFETIGDLSDRELILEYNNTPGLVYWYPKIKLNGLGFHKFTLKYDYVDEENQFENLFFFKDKKSVRPIELKFKTLYSMLAFIKMTYFKNEGYEAIGQVGDDRREQFNRDLTDIVNDEFRRGIGALDDQYKIFYYAPKTIIGRMYPEKIWRFLEKAVKHHITNIGTNKEDVVSDLIKILAFNTKDSDYFLDQLMERKVEKECLLNWFAWRLDGVDFKSFLQDVLMPKWESSSYRVMGDITMDRFRDTDGPIILSYKSDKTLGFFHSNCDVSYDEDKDRLLVVHDTGKVKPVSDYDAIDYLVASQAITSGGLPTIKEPFNYHPYYPIVVPNHSDQKTTVEFKDVIPAIYLKMAEDGAFWQNVATAAEYALDIVTTFSGIGNVKKFSYLFKLAARAKNLKTVSQTAKNVLVFKQVVRGSAATIEISSGALNGMLKLTGVKDKYPELYASISEYLFFLECASLSGELSLGLRAALRKSAQKTLNNSGDLNKLLRENVTTSLKTSVKNVANETYAAMIHLWEMAGIIVRNVKDFADNVKLALAELRVGVFDVLDSVDFKNMLPKLVQVEISGFGKIEVLMMSEDMKILFAGTRKQFEEFAEKVTKAANKSKEELTKLLNEAAEKAKQAKRRRIALRTYASKFEQKFHKHFDGEIMIRSKRGKETLWLQGAHNHTVNGSIINIRTIRKPPGIKFADLPDDVPFIANVEFRYGNRLLPKKSTSSFFPKNWDIVRIKEEIALVYDDLVKSGKNFSTPPFKYKAMSSDGTFEILIEFDKFGNITNAYPNIKI